MKKEWVKPAFTVEKFAANEYVAASCWCIEANGQGFVEQKDIYQLDGRCVESTYQPVSKDFPKGKKCTSRWNGLGFQSTDYDFCNAGKEDQAPSGEGWYYKGNRIDGPRVTAGNVAHGHLSEAIKVTVSSDAKDLARYGYGSNAS